MAKPLACAGRELAQAVTWRPAGAVKKRAALVA
jgi:hypothetical protein